MLGLRLSGKPAHGGPVPCRVRAGPGGDGLFPFQPCKTHTGKSRRAARAGTTWSQGAARDARSPTRIVGRFPQGFSVRLLLARLCSGTFAIVSLHRIACARPSFVQGEKGRPTARDDVAVSRPKQTTNARAETFPV